MFVSLYGCTMKNTYCPVEAPRLIDATYVAMLFDKPADWFKRDLVRKALYSRGFPRAVIRGRWSRMAVDSWFAKEGPR